MREARYVSLFPRTTLHSDSKQEPLNIFKNPWFLGLSKKVKKNAILTKKRDVNCPVFSDSRWAILPFLLLADGVIILWLFPAAFQNPLRIAGRLSCSLWAFPSGFPIFPIFFEQCPVAA
jgi:hypothetical protein